MKRADLSPSLSRHGQLGRRRLLTTGMVGAAALAVACGGRGRTGESGARPSTPRGQAATAETPVEGGTLRYHINSAPTAFDPYLNTSFSAQEPWGFISNRILKYKVGPEYGPFDLTFEPDVAAAMPEQPEPTRVIVKLRPDIRYHDRPPLNGRQMVAEDIAYSYERYMAVGQAKPFLEVIDSYELPDQLTIVFKLKRPSASFISNLASHTLLWIIPKEIPGPDGKVAATGPFVGAGPFIFERYDTDVQTSFIKNHNYFVKGLPHVDRVERPIISNPATLDANFRSGKLSFLYQIEGRDRLNELQRSVPGAGKLVYMTSDHPRLELAIERAPFNDARVRRALSIAINRDELAAGLDFMDFDYASHAFPAGYTPFFLSPRSPDFGENAKWFKFDLREAKQLLSAAGYPDGFEVLYHYTHEYNYAKPEAELLFAQLQKAGIRLRLQQYTYTDYQNRFRVGDRDKRRYEGIAESRSAVFADPSGYFTTYWSYKGTRNMTDWRDDYFEDMVAKTETEFDYQRRVKLFHDIQRYMAGHMPGVPLVTPANAVLWQPNVRNFFYKSDYGHAAEMDLVVWLAR